MTKNEWLNYFFHTDFSADEASLKEIPKGALDGETATLLAAAIGHTDTGEFRGNWTDKEGDQFSLQHAQVIYNGKNSTSLPTKFTNNAVLGLEFDEQSVQPEPGVRIYLGYNIPDGEPTIPDTEAQDEQASVETAQATAEAVQPDAAAPAAGNTVSDQDYSDQG